MCSVPDEYSSVSPDNNHPTGLGRLLCPAHIPSQHLSLMLLVTHPHLCPCGAESFLPFCMSRVGIFCSPGKCLSAFMSLIILRPDPDD